MTYSPEQSLEAINLSSVSGHSVATPFGRNPSVGTGSFEFIWFNGGTYNWLQTATTIRIRAGGNAADDAAGSGAQEVTIHGLDQNWNEVTETLATAGASASSATTTTWMRVNHAEVSKAGTYTGTNVGDIVFEETAGSLVLANIEADVGRTQMGLYSVPAAKTAYMNNHEIVVASNQSAKVRLIKREGADVVTTPFTPTVQIWQGEEISGIQGGTHPSWHKFPEKTDIFWQAQASGSAAPVSVEFDLIIVDD